MIFAFEDTPATRVTARREEYEFARELHRIHYGRWWQIVRHPRGWLKSRRVVKAAHNSWAQAAIEYIQYTMQ